jgi:phosphoenolpyruvate carboxylase
MPEPNNPAARAQPRGIGTSTARDPLAREVKLLGSLLGQVIIEQAGLPALELVERVRRATIAVRRHGGGVAQRRRLSNELDAVDLPSAEVLIRSFSLYFQLTNLAEEKQRIRRLRRRQRQATRGVIDESLGQAVLGLRRQGVGEERLRALLDDLLISPVLTAHPTEARRRTMLVALRRAYGLLDQLDDPRLTPAEDSDVRRRLREEVTLLWHTSPLRAERPDPLDEVRSVMAFFDESLFTVTPRLYRSLDHALARDSSSDTSKAGTLRSPRVVRRAARHYYDPLGRPLPRARFHRRLIRAALLRPELGRRASRVPFHSVSACCAPYPAETSRMCISGLRRGRRGLRRDMTGSALGL